MKLPEELTRRLEELGSLPNGWCGEHSIPPSPITIGTAKKVIEKIGVIPNIDDITATPYGSIVLDYYSGKDNTDLISVEAGNEMIGYFTDFSDGRANYAHDGFYIDNKMVLDFLCSLVKT